MNLWTRFSTWWRRTFAPNEFDNGYAWAKHELWWGVTPEELLARCDSPDKTEFDRGAEQAVRDQLSKESK